MCIEAGLSPRLVRQIRWAVNGSFVGYEDIQGGFEQLWMPGAGSAEEPGILQRHAQGCVEPSGGLEDSKLPLSAPTGVQLAPTSPMLVEGELCELRRESLKDHPCGGCTAPRGAVRLDATAPHRSVGKGVRGMHFHALSTDRIPNQR
jgi:hypothetical protein